MNVRIIGAVALAVALTALVVFFRTGDAETSDGLLASGTVEATEADLGFALPGRIEEIAFREGDAVSGGVILAHLDAREGRAAETSARARLAAAEARLQELRRGARPQEVAQVEAAVASARAAQADAAREAERAERLFTGGAISRQTLDRTRTALEMAEAAARQAEQQAELVRRGPREEVVAGQAAMVEQARADVERAESVLTNAVIRAPFPGVVTLRHREPGEIVNAGAPVVTVLDPTDRWVRIYVREDRIGRVRIGMPARIVSDTWPDRVYDGEVIFIGSEAEFTPRNVQTPDERTKLVYPVKVRITGDPAFELKPGIPADVTLVEN